MDHPVYTSLLNLSLFVSFGNLYIFFLYIQGEQSKYRVSQKFLPYTPISFNKTPKYKRKLISLISN